MPSAEQTFKVVPVDELTPAARNPRRGDVLSIRRSIEANGFYGTIVARAGTGEILAGNHRYLAACELGMSTVPVTFVTVDDATAKRILLADNATSDSATMDGKILSELLAEVMQEEGADGLAGAGYTPEAVAELEGLIGKLEIETGDAPVEEPQQRFGVIIPMDSEQRQREVIEWAVSQGLTPRAMFT